MINLVPEVTFSLFLNNHEKIDEEKIRLDNQVRERIGTESVLEGCISIKLGEEQFLLEDEIVPWIQNLCLKPIPFLINGDDATIYYFSREGTLNIQNNTEQLTFIDNFNNSLTLPFKSTITALADCGARFIEIMEPIKKDNPTFMNAINNLKLLKVMAEDSIEIMQYM